MLALAAMMLSSPVYGAITVIDYYRLGEADAAATNGATVDAASTDSAGARNLARVGSPTYTYAVSIDAALHAGSQLAVSFSGNTQGLTNGVLTTNIDNFGIEAWVRPNTLSGTHSLAYNGSTVANGWGLYQTGATYSGAYAGRGFVGSGVAMLNGWSHLALVRASGITTLYVNGVASVAGAALPFVPTAGFAIGMPGQGGANDNFIGQIDEVRVFTFAAGQFSTNDLLWRSSANTSLFTMTAALLTDVNSNGQPNPGDTLRYTIVITNNTGGTLSNVVYNSAAVSNAPLVPGSVKTVP